MPRLLKPRALGPGATIAIAAPGGPVDPARLEEGAALWREAGFRVVQRDDVSARRGYLAGDDKRRVQELAKEISTEVTIARLTDTPPPAATPPVAAPPPEPLLQPE